MVARKCHKCHYDLRGLVELRCPECGTLYDSGFAKRAQRRRRWLAAALVIIGLYVSFAWLLFDPELNRLSATHVPILPGLAPAMFIEGFLFHSRIGDTAEWFLAAWIVIVIVQGLSWYAGPGRGRLVGSVIASLALGGLFSWLFRILWLA